MADICVPVPRFKEKRTAEVEVKFEGKTQTFNYRVESFDWEVEEESTKEDYAQPSITEFRIGRLRDNINSYDKDWVLIQIYNAKPTDKFIQVLFRHKNPK